MLSLQFFLINFVALITVASATSAAFFTDVQVLDPFTSTDNCTNSEHWLLIQAELFAAQGPKDDIYLTIPKVFGSFPIDSFALKYNSEVIGTVSHNDSNVFTVSFTDDKHVNLTTTFNFLAKLSKEAIAQISSPRSIGYVFYVSTGPSYSSTINYISKNMLDFTSDGGIYKNNNTAWFTVDIPLAALSSPLYFKSVPATEDAYVYDIDLTTIEIVTEVDAFNQPVKSVPFTNARDFSDETTMQVLFTSNISGGKYVRINFFSEELNISSITNLITFTDTTHSSSLSKRDNSISSSTNYYGESISNIGVAKDFIEEEGEVAVTTSAQPTTEMIYYNTTSIDASTTSFDSEITSELRSVYTTYSATFSKESSNAFESTIEPASHEQNITSSQDIVVTSLESQSSVFTSISVPTTRNRTEDFNQSSDSVVVSSFEELLRVSSSQCSPYYTSYTITFDEIDATVSRTNNKTTTDSISTLIFSSSTLATTGTFVKIDAGKNSINSNSNSNSEQITITSSTKNTSTSTSQLLDTTGSTYRIITLTQDGKVTTFTTWIAVATESLYALSVSPVNSDALNKETQDTISTSIIIVPTFVSDKSHIENTIESDLVASVITTTIDGEVSIYTTWRAVSTLPISKTKAVDSLEHDIKITSSITTLSAVETNQIYSNLTFSDVTTTINGEVATFTSSFPGATLNSSTNFQNPTTASTFQNSTSIETDMSFSVVTATINGEVTSYTTYYPVSTITPAPFTTIVQEIGQYFNTTYSIITKSDDAQIATYTNLYPISNMASTTLKKSDTKESTFTNTKDNVVTVQQPKETVTSGSFSISTTTHKVTINAEGGDVTSLLGFSSLTTFTASNFSTNPIVSNYEGEADTIRVGFTGLFVFIFAFLF